MLGASQTEVRLQEDFVVALIKWNGPTYRQLPHFDKKFLKVLLVSFIGVKNLIENDIPAAVIELVQGNLKN